ncbi:hypothetical protein VTN77DRAFT_9254 [Rasamsonia byssochlamydoides]|uniref:uncharacterized protein n=1 Tax=Rasamsonia byssochlamydoides TaxID=89139 RepID=UPI003743386F
MPKITLDNGKLVKLSLLDVLKSDKTLELEAALRRAKAAKKAVQGIETPESETEITAQRSAIEKTAIERFLAEKAAAKTKAKEKEARDRVAAADREAIEKAAIEKYLAKKAAEEKAAKEKEEADRATAAAVIERYLAEKAAEKQAAAEKAEAIRVAAEKVASEKLRGRKILTGRTDAEANTGATTVSVAYVWTPKQDKRLRELKLANNTWKAISSELEDRPINELKRRWAKIRNSADSSDDEEKGKSREVEKMRRKGKHQMNAKGKSRQMDSDSSDGDEPASSSERFEDKRQKRRVAFSDPLVTSKTKAESIPAREVRKYFYMDDKFTLEEIILLHKLADHYENEKWLRVSSRFFDKTGRRISPDDAKLRVKTDLLEN